ncbi:MAG: hypothetical protein KDA53_07245, partial [Hyphomonas sp.]|nr:hypothetical protein [Hyphomonas sp.]
MLEIDLPEGLRAATMADWREVGSITGEAFEEDPVNLWIFGNTKPLRPVFSVLAQETYLKDGICHLAGDGGATMWIESGRRKELGLWPTLRLAPSLLFRGSKGALQRGLKAADEMDANHPKDPHLYLFTIGTR